MVSMLVDWSSVPHPLSSTQKGHSFSAPKFPQFNTKNLSVQHTPQLNTKNPSVQHTPQFNTKSLQFNTPISLTSKRLGSRQKKLTKNSARYVLN